jgi:hypothetical protein
MDNSESSARRAHLSTEDHDDTRRTSVHTWPCRRRGPTRAAWTASRPIPLSGCSRRACRRSQLPTRAGVTLRAAPAPTYERMPGWIRT